LQGEILSRVLEQPDLLQESFGDLAISDFVGKVHQSLFRTLLKLSQEGRPFDITTVADSWGAQQEVGDPVAYISGLLDTHDLPASNLRLRVEKLHKLSQLRRLRFMGELLQRHAESAKTEPDLLMEKLSMGVEALRAGYDLNGDMLPYSPRNLARRPDLIRLSSVEAKPVPWLWRPYLSFGMINMLSGEPGSGKTYLALAFAAALTLGKIPFTGDDCFPLDVLYLSIENDPEYVVRPRFDLLEGDVGHFHLLQGAKTGEGSKARRESVRLSDVPLLDAALKETKAKLLVVDPIQSYLGGEVDMHRSNETRPLLDGLAFLARKYQACLLILRHFAKTTTGSAINRGLGSIDLTGAARTELHAGKRDGRHVLAHAKSNIGPFGKSMGYELCDDGSFHWTGESAITADDLAATGNMTTEDRDAVDESAECLKDMLHRGAKSSRDIFSAMKDVGASIAAVKRAKKKLGVKSRKRGGSGEGWEWYLEGYEDGEIASS
jgi:hypothetical protein